MRQRVAFVPALPADAVTPRPPSWMQVVSELRAHPFEWAVVREYASENTARSQASRVRNGRFPAFPADEFEAVHTRSGQLLMRWVGKK